MPRPTSLGDALAKLVRARGIAQPGADDALAEAWRSAATEVVGEQALPHTRVLGLNRGTLRVGVTSAALLGELNGFHAAALNAAATRDAERTGIRRVKFELRGDLRVG